MIKIEFVSKDTDPFAAIYKEIKLDDDKRKLELDALGFQTAEAMKTIIQSNKKRPQAGEPTTLENAITVTKMDNGFGVGDVDIMNHQAPQWAAVNFGSSHMVGHRLKKGTFDPGTPQPSDAASRTGRWKIGRYGSVGGFLYSPLVKNPIPAMNYIEKTIFWLQNQIDAMFK